MRYCNIDRFPVDFIFQLTEKKSDNLKSQFATSSWGGRRKRPFVFTEHGVLMLSSVLNSSTAIQVNIKIMKYNNTGISHQVGLLYPLCRTCFLFQ
jgi:hypothetical protein